MADFAQTFDRLKRKASISDYRISGWTGLDAGYISRLRSGQRQNPSHDVVIAISMALFRSSESIHIWDIDALLLSANYAPLTKKG